MEERITTKETNSSLLVIIEGMKEEANVRR